MVNAAARADEEPVKSREYASDGWIDRVVEHFRKIVTQAHESGQFGECGLTVVLKRGRPVNVYERPAYSRPDLINAD